MGRWATLGLDLTLLCGLIPPTHTHTNKGRKVVAHKTGLEPVCSTANALRKGTPRAQAPTEGRAEDIPKVPTQLPKPHQDMGGY